MPNRKTLIATLAVAVLMLPFAAACAQTPSDQTANHEAMNDQGDTMSNPDNPRVKLHTNKGDIVLELYADKAPETVKNFLGYVEDGFYDGTIFHRVIPGFMIQGGGFTAEMQQKPTRDPIQNEADNGVSNERGTIAMARTMDPNSATAQFFINTVDNTPLDHTAKTAQGWGYAVFGKVVKGMDVVDAISGVATTNRGPHQNVPAQPVVIEKASVESAGG